MENLSLFIKPFLNCTDGELIETLKELGISRIEYPIRDGLKITPDNCEEEFPKIYRNLKENGIEVISVAGPVGAFKESIFKCMKSCGITCMRVMLPMLSDTDYIKAEQRYIKELSEGIEFCKKYHAKIVIQPHNGRFLSNVYELRSLIEKLDPKYVRAVWDLGHSALTNEVPEKAVDIIFDYIDVVNLKSAYFKRIETDDGIKYWAFYTTGDECPCDWERAVNLLKERGYKGSFCTHAEYSDSTEWGCLEGEEAKRLLKKDLEYMQNLNI